MAFGTLLGEAYVDIRPAFDKFAGEMSKGIKTGTEQGVQQASGSLTGFEQLGRAAFLGITTAAIGFGVAAVHAGLEGEKAAAQLANTVRGVGGNFDQVEPKVAKLSDRFAKWGFTNDEVETSLSRMIQTTGNVDKSLGLMALAADVARARHMDLSAAALLVGKVAEGNVTQLKRLTGVTVEGTTANEKAAAGLKLLQERFGGSAQAQAETYAGKLAAFRAQVENLTEKIGLALLPVLGRLAGDGAKVVNFFEHNTAAATALGVVIGGPLAAAMALYIAREAVMLGTKVADFFVTAGGAALRYAQAVGTLITGTQNMGLAAAAGGLAIGALAVGFGFLVQQMNAAQAAANSWARNFATAAGTPQQQIDAIKAKIAELQTGLDKSGAAAHIPFVRMAFGAQQAEDKIHGLKTILNGLIADQEGHKKAAEAGGKAIGDEGDQAAGTAVDMQALSDKTGLSTDNLDKLAKKLSIDVTKGGEDAARSLEAATVRLGEQNSGTLILNDALAKLSDKTADATDRSKAFKTALDELIGGNIDAEKAVVNFQASVDGLSTKLKDNKLSFDATTQAGRDNITMVEDSVTKIRDHIEALKNQGASATELEGAFDGDTAALRRQLEQAGLTTAQIDDLVKKYGLVPSNLQTVISADTSQVDAAIRRLQTEFDSLLTTESSAGVANAGRVPRFARGGFFPGNDPQLAVVGDSREVMLPLDDPARVRELLAQAGLLGGGNVPATTSAVAIESGAVVQQFYVTGQPDPATLAMMGQVAHDSVVSVLDQWADKRRAGASS